MYSAVSSHARILTCVFFPSPPPPLPLHSSSPSTLFLSGGGGQVYNSPAPPSSLYSGGQSYRGRGRAAWIGDVLDNGSGWGNSFLSGGKMVVRPPPLPPPVCNRGRDWRGGGTVGVGTVFFMVVEDGRILFFLGGRTLVLPPPNPLPPPSLYVCM